MQRRIIESHRRLAGQPPSEAELNLLETARRCELYGMKMHPAKVGDGDGSFVETGILPRWEGDD